MVYCTSLRDTSAKIGLAGSNHGYLSLHSLLIWLNYQYFYLWYFTAHSMRFLLLLPTDAMRIHTMNAFLIDDYTGAIYLTTSSLLTLQIVDWDRDWCVLVLAPARCTGMEYLSPLVALLLFIIPLSYLPQLSIHSHVMNLSPWYFFFWALFGALVWAEVDVGLSA